MYADHIPHLKHYIQHGRLKVDPEGKHASEICYNPILILFGIEGRVNLHAAFEALLVISWSNIIKPLNPQIIFQMLSS